MPVIKLKVEMLKRINQAYVDNNFDPETTLSLEELGTTEKLRFAILRQLALIDNYVKGFTFYDENHGDLYCETCEEEICNPYEFSYSPKPYLTEKGLMFLNSNS